MSDATTEASVAVVAVEAVTGATIPTPSATVKETATGTTTVATIKSEVIEIGAVVTAEAMATTVDEADEMAALVVKEESPLPNK